MTFQVDILGRPPVMRPMERDPFEGQVPRPTMARVGGVRRVLVGIPVDAATTHRTGKYQVSLPDEPWDDLA